MPGRTEHHVVAGRAAAIGVGAGVVRAVVRLDLREAELDRTVRCRADEDASLEVGRDLQYGRSKNSRVRGVRSGAAIMAYEPGPVARTGVDRWGPLRTRACLRMVKERLPWKGEGAEPAGVGSRL